MTGFAESKDEDSTTSSKQPQKWFYLNMTAPTVNFVWTSKFNLEGEITQPQIQIGAGAASRV